MRSCRSARPIWPRRAKPGEAEKRYDVLLAIQPSAMGPQEMDEFHRRDPCAASRR